MMIRCISMFMIFLSMLWVNSREAYAYLDPGQGSYFFQMLITGLLVGFWGIKSYWYRILEFFKKIFSKK